MLWGGFKPAPRSRGGRAVVKSTPCERCDARCCRTYVVPLNGADIARLQAFLGSPLSEWCVLEPVSEGIQDYGYFSIRLSGEERYVVCLKREKGSCIFLRRSNLRAACSIHEARPGMCRSYPITFCSGKAEHTDDCICPERWVLNSSGETAFSKLYIDYNAAFADFKEITDLWEKSYRCEYIITGRMTADHETALQVFLEFLAGRINR